MNLPWLQALEPFPSICNAWDDRTPAPGLLAAGGGLSVERLRMAYASCIFPWYSEGQPILWWSPDPRMVLHVGEFRLHRSLRQTLKKFQTNPACEIRIDHDFSGVVAECAQVQRNGQPGTWIGPDMQVAYGALHRAGNAHSVETWQHGQRVGGLYCVSIGRAVFGESMFSHVPNASKIALSALVALCRRSGVARIDCQQNTSHLASLGAREVPRASFATDVERECQRPAFEWRFESLYWDELMPSAPAHDTT